MSDSKKGLSSLLKKFEGLKSETKDRIHDNKNSQNLLENLELRRKSSGPGILKAEKTNEGLINILAQNLNPPQEKIIFGNTDEVNTKTTSPKHVAFNTPAEDKPQQETQQRHSAAETNTVLKINNRERNSHEPKLSPTPSPRSSINISENTPIPAPRRRKKATIQITKSPKKQANQTLLDNLTPKPKENQTFLDNLTPKPKEKQTLPDNLTPKPKENQTLLNNLTPKPKENHTLPDNLTPKPKENQTFLDNVVASRTKENISKNGLEVKPVIQQVVNTKSKQPPTQCENINGGHSIEQEIKGGKSKQIENDRAKNIVTRQKSLKATKIHINKMTNDKTKIVSTDETNKQNKNPSPPSETKAKENKTQKETDKQESKPISTRPLVGAKEPVIKITKIKGEKTSKSESKNPRSPNSTPSNLLEIMNTKETRPENPRPVKDHFAIDHEILREKKTKREEENERAIEEEQKYVKIIEEEEERLNSTQERSRSIHLEIQGAFVVNEGTMTSQESTLAAMKSMMTSPKRALNSVKRSMSVRKQRKSAPNADDGFEGIPSNRARERTSSQNSKTLRKFSPRKSLNSVKRSMSLKMKGLRPKSGEMKENKLERVFQRTVTSSTGSFHVDDVSGVLLNLGTHRRRNREGSSVSNSPGSVRRSPAKSKLSSRSFKSTKPVKPKNSYESGSKTLGSKEFEKLKDDWRPKFGILKKETRTRRSADVGDWDKVSDFGGMGVDYRRNKSTNDQLLRNEYDEIHDNYRAKSWNNKLDIALAIEQENEYQFIDEVFADIIKQDNYSPLGYDRALISSYREEADIEDKTPNDVVIENQPQETKTEDISLSNLENTAETGIKSTPENQEIKPQEIKENREIRNNVPIESNNPENDTQEIYDEVARDEVEESDVINNKKVDNTEGEDIYDEVPADEDHLDCGSEFGKMDSICGLGVPQIRISPQIHETEEDIAATDVKKDKNWNQSRRVFTGIFEKRASSLKTGHVGHAIADDTDVYVTMANQMSDVSNGVTINDVITTTTSVDEIQTRAVSPAKVVTEEDKDAGNKDQKDAEKGEDTEERKSGGITGLFSRLLTPKRERGLERSDSKKSWSSKGSRTPSPKTPNSKKKMKKERKSKKKKTRESENTLHLPEYSPTVSKSSGSSCDVSPQFQKVLFSSVKTNRGSEILLFDEHNLSESYVQSQLQQGAQIYDQPPSDVTTSSSDVIEQIYDQTPDDLANDDNNNNDFRKLLDEIVKKNEAKRKSSTSLKIYSNKNVTSPLSSPRNSDVMTSVAQNSGSDIIIYDIPNEPALPIDEWYQVPTSVPTQNQEEPALDDDAKTTTNDVANDDVTFRKHDDLKPRDTDLVQVFENDAIYSETPECEDQNYSSNYNSDRQVTEVAEENNDVIYDETPMNEEAIYDQTPDEPLQNNCEKPHQPENEPIYSEPPLGESAPPNTPMVSALSKLMTSLRSNSRKSSSSVSISSFEDDSDANDDVFNSSLNASLYSLPPMEQSHVSYDKLNVETPAASSVEYDDPSLLGNHSMAAVEGGDYQEIDSDGDDYVNVSEVKKFVDKKGLRGEERVHSGATPRRAPQVTVFQAYDTLTRAPPSPSIISGDYARYNKVLEIAHGECALSVPYVAVNRTPGTEGGLNTAGDIYVSDCNGDCIDVYDNNGKHKSTINIPGFPRGIASYTSRHILCASCGASEIYVVDVTRGSVLRKIGKRAGIKNPRCVTMHPDNQSFMTSDIRHLHNWSLLLFDIRTGNIASTITSAKNLDLKIGWPEFITYRHNSDHQFYISDSESNCCFAYDTRKNTRPTMTISKYGTGNGEMINPCGIAYLPGGKLTLNSAEGSLLVSDWGNNRVSAYDGTSGMFQCHLIDRSTDSLSTPYDLKVDTGGAIYLSESETSNIKVYKII